MRKAKWLSIFLLSIAVPCLAQHTAVNVSADSGLPRDPRPFGKYLVEICTLSGEARTLTCTPTLPPLKAPVFKKDDGEGIAATRQTSDQTITLKLVCNPTTKDPCDPKYPLEPGDDFFVAATSDSGQTVRQRVISGSATPVGGSGTVHYRANAPGVIVVRATANKTARVSDAAPIDLLLPVVADRAKAPKSCAVLPPVVAQSSFLDVTSIVSMLGNPTPFLLAAQGSNTIAIYSTRQPLHDDDLRILASFQDEIVALAGRTAASLGIVPAAAKPFSVELKIPHASALGDLATRVNGLNLRQFTVVDVSSDRIRVTSPTTPDCDTWQGFLSDIRQMVWQLISEPMGKKLFYLSSTDVATAFSSLSAGGAPAAAAPAATATSTTPAATPSTGASASPAAGGGSAPTASSPAAPVTPAAPAAASPAVGSGSSNATITVTQPAGSNIQISSDTTPCVVAGLAFGNASACGAASAGAASSGAGSASSTAPPTAPVTPTLKAPLGMASVAVAAGNGEQTPPDLLVYSDTNPGDDAQIQERNRILALLDLPRPEMIITAWVTQNSTTNQIAMGAFSSMVKGLVADYDHQFENVVLRGWAKVKERAAGLDYFDEPFRSYIADRFVADTFQPTTQGSSAQDLAQAFLDRSQAQLADPLAPMKRSNLGICERGRYCLGYYDLFNPVKPALTDLLLMIIAAEDPAGVAQAAVAEIEGTMPPAKVAAAEIEITTPPSSDKVCGPPDSTHSAKREQRDRCLSIWKTLDIDHLSPPPSLPGCTEQDFRGILDSLMGDPEHEARVHLKCFSAEAGRLLNPSGTEHERTPPYGAGLIRAAVADFLFNYKMSQQYPHEFVSYDLSHSADALNNALTPLIDAFNRDLWSYQMFMRADMQYRVERLNIRTDGRCCVKKLFGLDKPSFFNDGLVTVRTISGQSTYVNTATQSFLNGSTAPELTSLLSSFTSSPTGANAPAPGVGSLAGTVLSASPAGRAAALASVLSNYQTTFAQIGRSLQISAIPRTLNTASSAEIAVTLNADESAAPAYFGGGATDPATNTSRVANHDTATRVRVDSIKLFEVSSFTAIVERSRSRFPLLPPFVEIPYIGTLAGIPLGAAKEFHASTAILSAYVEPTAADIATGLRFFPDLLVDAINQGSCSFAPGVAGPTVTNACLFRKALSLRDFGREPVGEFNRRMVGCLATEERGTDCGRVTLNGVPRTY